MVKHASQKVTSLNSSPFNSTSTAKHIQMDILGQCHILQFFSFYKMVCQVRLKDPCVLLYSVLLCRTQECPLKTQNQSNYTGLLTWPINLIGRQPKDLFILKIFAMHEIWVPYLLSKYFINVLIYWYTWSFCLVLDVDHNPISLT